MAIGTITFILSWLAFYFFARKNRFQLYVPTAYIGIILAMITDLLMFIYPLWEYPGSPVKKFGIQMINSFGIYFVVLYFFLQTLPKKQTILTIMRHIFYWSTLALFIELLFIYIGFIEHGLWWNMWLSYASDWILFTVFYLHHKWVLHSIRTCTIIRFDTTSLLKGEEDAKQIGKHH